MKSFDDIAFLAGSPNRIAVLAALTDGETSDSPSDSGATRRSIAAATGVSRGTATKILTELEARGWVTFTVDQTYRVTPTGRLVAGAVRATEERLAALSSLEPIVEYIPWSALSLTPRDLVDAELTLPSAADPLAPLARLNTLSRNAARSRTATPVIDPQAFAISLSRILDGSLETELVVDRWVGELFLENDELPTEQALTSGLTMYLVDESVPLPVSLVDDLVIVGVIDDNLAPRALVESDASTVREWGAVYFESLRARAEKV